MTGPNARRRPQVSPEITAAAGLLRTFGKAAIVDVTDAGALNTFLGQGEVADALGRLVRDNDRGPYPRLFGTVDDSKVVVVLGDATPGAITFARTRPGSPGEPRIAEAELILPAGEVGSWPDQGGYDCPMAERLAYTVGGNPHYLSCYPTVDPPEPNRGGWHYNNEPGTFEVYAVVVQAMVRDVLALCEGQAS